VDDLAEYVAAMRPQLLRTAVLLGCPERDAEDLVQTALARCLRSWRRVARADSRDAYITRILVNTFRDARARRWNGEIPTDKLPDRPGVDPAVAEGLVVRQALSLLSREHRDVLVLRYFADLSERQTAEILKIPVGTVKSRASRAIAALSENADIAALTGERGR
jgi:RNA polymerase sigma-70 factor (sigma-E family)